MLIDEPEILHLANGIVHGITHDTAVQEDLIQEALLHLWQDELRYPGHTRSWYLQHCRFQLIDYLRAGHSVDALKHRASGCALSADPDDFEPHAEYLASLDDVAATASADDFFDELTRRLGPRGIAIVHDLVSEYSVPEIARELGVTEQAVRKHRRAIRAEARRLRAA
jgi:RNA polymerase sigma factor (sigma-70 family)